MCTHPDTNPSIQFILKSRLMQYVLTRWLNAGKYLPSGQSSKELLEVVESLGKIYALNNINRGKQNKDT